ncbi:glycosyltransferase [Vibrio fortis]|uniref:glycosyltransferase n=1 Tax=Vibrio fortis TaxID=212667 RepID=UPI0040698892
MKISVIMAVYKEPVEYIKSAIESTLTSLVGYNYEFIIVIDNPHLSEESINYLKSKGDSISIIFNSTNIGLARSLNVALDLVSGDYIMRMDADDICHPLRVKTQLEFILKNSDLSLIGSDIMKIDSNGQELAISKSISSVEECISSNSPFYNRTLCYHPTWFAKADVLKEYRYNEITTSQDVELQFRLLRDGKKLSNVPMPLLYYRISESSLSLRKGWEQVAFRKAINSFFIEPEKYNFEDLLFRIKRIDDRRITKAIFVRLHKKYVDALANKNYLNLLVICAISPFHFYKTILIARAKRWKS